MSVAAATAVAALVVYLIGWFLCVRVMAGVLAYEFGTPDGFDIAMSLMMGGLLALVWPIVFLIRWLNQRDLILRGAAPLVRIPPHVRIRELEREKRKQEWRIRDLEREVGIR